MSNPYCVPAALGFLLNITVDAAELLLKEELGDKPITGVLYPLILKILKKEGFGYIKTYCDLKTPNHYLICFKGHVGVIKNGIYFDNQNRDGTTKFKVLLKKSTACFKIFKIDPTLEN